jgi:virginiamycin B lyase
MIGGARTFLIALLAISIAGCAATTTTPPSLPSAPKPGGGPLIVSPHSPYAIVLGPDKNIWFTEYEGDRIGMMTPAGEVMRFPIAPDGIAERLTGGPDGALWFTDPKGNRIGRIAVDGKIKYVALPTPECGPTGITTGADGMIYFTEHAASRIGRMTTDGSLTEFTLRPKAGPAEIVTGHDGAVYFIEDEAGRIGRISPAGTIDEFAIPSAHSIPSAIASGPDASIYFAELGVGKIGKMKLDGSFDEYVTPGGRPLGLAAGSDGNLWATIPKERLIYRMTSGGDFLAYRGTEQTVPAFIIAAPDGYLYFSEPNGKIGRIDTKGDIVEFEVGK